MIAIFNNRPVQPKTKGSRFTIIKIKNPYGVFYVRVAPNDETMGLAYGSGSYREGSEIQIRAEANHGYRFAQWSDGSIEPTRTLVVEEDITLTAIFERDSSMGILTYIPNKGYLNPPPNRKVFIYNSLYESL